MFSTYFNFNIDHLLRKPGTVGEFIEGQKIQEVKEKSGKNQRMFCSFMLTQVAVA